VISDHEAVEKTSWGRKAVPVVAQSVTQRTGLCNMSECATLVKRKFVGVTVCCFFVKCSRRKVDCTNLAEGLARQCKVRFDRSQSHLLPSP
jgi:hypothetical protein